MTRDQKLALIRQKCVEANPEREWWCPIPQPVRLADVLCAYYRCKWTNTKRNGIVSRWLVEKDDVTEQSDDCLAFIADLLANKQEQ